MENPEEVLQLLERFTKLKQKEIPRELDDYLGFVARTGDTVYRWAIVKHLFREKLVHVITDFHDNTPSIADLPQCPNVDPFNYERMKRILLDRLDAFNSAPFTVQRICELLTEPRKQYTRIDKYMRAVEKNILVVSTQEPGRRRSESENGDSLDSIVNGDLEVNVDIEMDNEAFGIDAGGEIVPSSAAAAPVVTAEPTEPAPVSEEEPARGVAAVTEEPEVSKEAVDEVAATPAAEPAVADKEEESKEGPIGDEPVTVNPSAEDGQPEADIPKEDPKPAEELNEPSEPLVPQPIEEPSTAEDLPVPEVQPLVVPTETDSTNDPSPVEESHDKDLPDGSESVESKVEATSDSADDGQPAPKLAKLSDEPVMVEPAVEEAPQTSAVETDSLVEAEKDDVSSGSTTDSGGSSAASVESEPTVSTTTTSSSTDSSTPAEPESADRVAPEEPVPTVETLPEPEKEQPIPCEPEVAPSAAPVAEPEPTPVETEPTVKESIEEPAVGVEMETAAVVVPENVMATDEEDTIQSPVDAVVPMAADVPEAVKPDDNAMDVDESSVEPMDQ